MSRDERGFTFVEIMLTLVIGLVVIAGLYRSFNTLHKWWISASVTAEQRQNARAGLETVTRDLEMAGYQTTNYGDPHKTGIAITFASAHEIEMDQQRMNVVDNDLTSVAYEPRLVYYHLATDVKTGRQHLYRQIRTQPGLRSPDELVAENVGAFTLAYFDKDNAAVAGLPPAAAGGSAAYTAGVAVPANSPLRAIRRIQVTLTTVPARTAPIGPAGRPFTLSASVMPQNLASAAEVTADNNPPAVPGGLAVIDTGSCSAKLRAKWDANTEPDLAGYIVFYGPLDKITVPVKALLDKSQPEVTLNPDKLLITKNADRTASPNTYSIQVAAYDSSGNHSARSAAVTGNPSPDVAAFGGADDTTVNPAKPSAPTGLTVTAGAADGQLVISWQPPADASATAGYRLYRSTTDFADGHIDDALRIVAEDTLTADVTTWTDANLDGCRTYYYAVASVNCDETLVAGYQYDSDDATASDYAVASGAPQETTPPPAPGLTAVADVQRALITLVNPLEGEVPDFDRTEIFWTRQDPVSNAVTDSAHVPDTDSGSEGIFRRRGSQVIVFDSEADPTPMDPSLIADASYTILAQSYDLCGNVSAAASQTLVIPGPSTCSDDPPGPPPDSFTNPTAVSCQSGTVLLGWEYPDQAVVADLVGFRVERSGPGTTVELTQGPTSARSWTDTGPLEAGAEYRYTITATDCVWERYLLSGVSLPYLDPLTTLTIGPVLPGGLRFHTPPTGTDELAAENFVTTDSDAGAPYTHHNNVRFWLQNTSRSPVTLKRMSVNWDNPNVVLDRVVIGGSPSDTTARTVNVGGAASGVTFSVDAEIEDVASGAGSPSGPVPVLLRFATPGGAVNRLTDMRSETLDLSLWVWNHSFLDAECSYPARVSVEVPRGPVLGGFSQSAPGTYGIDSYEVVGASGTARDTDVAVPYGIPVNVYGTAFDNSRELFADGVNRGFSALKLIGINAAAADPAAVPAMPVSGTFFERPLLSIGGNRYAIHRTTATPAGDVMPQESDRVTWYYALAVDATGNWDRVPNPDAGNYAYFQPPFDPCTVSPQPPVLTLESATATGAVLTWTAPTHYDNGLAIPASDTLTYDVFVKDAGGDPWPSTPAGENLSGTSFSHGADLLAGTYYYMVRAKNSCATGPRPSTDSNVVMECEGASGIDCSLFSVPATARYGDPITLTVSDFCAYQGNGVVDSVVFRVSSGATSTEFSATETGDGGTFTKTITAVWSGGGADQVLAPSGTLNVELLVSGATPCPTRTVTLTGGECFTTPNPPTAFSAVRGANNSLAAILTWVRPNYNTDGTPLADLAGYELESARCATWNSGAGNCATWSTWVGTVLNDPTAQAYTWSGLVLSERYKFRMRAMDSCATPNVSAWTSDSSVVRVR